MRSWFTGASLKLSTVHTRPRRLLPRVVPLAHQRAATVLPAPQTHSVPQPFALAWRADEVRRQGKSRVDALTQIKDFKRDIYALQWENGRGDMEVCCISCSHIPVSKPSSMVSSGNRPGHALCWVQPLLRRALLLRTHTPRFLMQIEDLLENNRALQLLKLPKNYQQLLEQARQQDHPSSAAFMRRHVSAS